MVKPEDIVRKIIQRKKRKKKAAILGGWAFRKKQRIENR